MGASGKFYKIVFIVVFILFSCSIVYAQSGREIAAKVFPSVTLIGTEDKYGQPLAIGSGFFIREDVVVTNFHVIENSTRGYVKLIGQNAKYDINGLVGFNIERDLALLKVSWIKMPTLSIGDDANIEIGDEIYVVGNPLGLEGTFSQGIVSGIRKIGEDRLFQITAPISPGSSGGPVLNKKGEVIGVAFATFSGGQNLNFAIPVSCLRPLLLKVNDTMPLPKFSSPKKSKPTFKGLGEPTAQGVVAVNYEREYMSGLLMGYTFTLRNNLRDNVKNIYYVIIFYGKDGKPIHYELSKYSEVIFPGLAKLLSVREFDEFRGKKEGAPWPGIEVIKRTSKAEIRVLSFEIVKSDSFK